MENELNAADIAPLEVEKVGDINKIAAKPHRFMQAARARMKKKGTVGLFGRKAAAAGESTQQYASEKYSAPGKLGKEARFAFVAKHKRGK